MMKYWGKLNVSSAYEVAHILDQARKSGVESWENLTGMLEQDLCSPPTWGGADVQERAALLMRYGFAVWSWDDYGVALGSARAPKEVRYESWAALLPSMVAAAA